MFINFLYLFSFKGNNMINAFTVDLEDWYHPEFVTKFVSAHQRKAQVEDAVKPLLELLDKHKVRATFFVLGQVAERHPELIERIYEEVRVVLVRIHPQHIEARVIWILTSGGSLTTRARIGKIVA